ncbi:MAG: hypothetical protein ACFFCS_16030 [Candidatus Hodarchaeota archaeon]
MVELKDDFKKTLSSEPFVLVIGKYDQTLGPECMYFSSDPGNDSFLGQLLRDAFHTKSKLVTLDYSSFYAQANKISVVDPGVRGNKQAFVLVLLRDASLPKIPTLHFNRIELLFHEIGRKEILKCSKKNFAEFYESINKIYVEKKELLPLESLHLQIRTEVNTIQGICEFLEVEKKNFSNFSKDDIFGFIEEMLGSCKEIIRILEESK